MDFLDALNCRKGDVIALTGGGGKTSTMYAIGNEAVKRGLKTILTTTTKIYNPEDRCYQVVTSDNPLNLLREVKQKLNNNPLVVVGSGYTQDNKLTGIPGTFIHSLFESDADLIVVEADGSAQKPLKAHASHEPVIPPGTTIVMPVLGIECLNKPLNEQNVHRPELASIMSGTSLGEIISINTVTSLLTHSDGYRKNLPAAAQWIPFINKIQSLKERTLAREIARKILQVLPCRILIGAAQDPDPVFEVISHVQ